MKKIFKKTLRFILTWKLFSLALFGLILGAIFYLLNLHFEADLTLAVISLIELIPLLKDMYEDLRSGSYGVDILAATAILASVLLKQDLAAIVVVIMLTGGESLDAYADRKAKKELNTLLKHSPRKAHLIKNGKEVDVKASLVRLGNKFIVKPGELIPADGIILEGSTSVDESSLTGESKPINKNSKDLVLSGSVNLDGSIIVKASSDAKDSQYQQIIKLVKSASESKSPFVRLADKYSIPFTILSFLIAGAVWYISGQPIRFLEVIIVATPCPLLLAAPIALVSGMSLASKYGVIVKTGSSLERLAEAKSIAFDKTGTLTTGKLNVTKVTSLDKKYSSLEILKYIASLEQLSSHIIARSINEYASSKAVKLLKIKNVQEVPGKGLIANLENQQILVGNDQLLKENELNNKLKTSSSTVYLAINQKVVGYITLEDGLRKETKSTLEKIKHLGFKNILMITGDNQQVAKNIAKNLAINEIHAEALPADKFQIIEKHQPKPIIFIGDGINDAPVLTVADVGIALGAKGSTAASESADMVILDDDLSRVYTVIKIAQHTFKVARQSILAGITLSVILMLMFASGKLLPVYGAILQEVVDVVVIFNALRAHYLKRI